MHRLLNRHELSMSVGTSYTAWGGSQIVGPPIRRRVVACALTRLGLAFVYGSGDALQQVDGKG